jgi:Tetratricopeptide repeat
MKHTAMFKMSVCILALIGKLALAQAALADDFTDCIAGQLGQRLAACTAVIDNPASSPNERVQALENRSVELSIAGKLAEAFEDVDKALKINPDSPIALNGRAWTLFRWKKTADGMDDVNKSLRLDGLSAPAWDTRAHLYQLLGDFERAFKEYETAVGFGGVPFIRTYQCGLKEQGLYKGVVDGIYSPDMRSALRACAFSPACDPLPKNEFEQDCENATS